LLLLLLHALALAEFFLPLPFLSPLLLLAI